MPGPRSRSGPARTTRRCAALAAALWVLAAGAADEDRQQPATIESDRAEIDRDAGQSRYFGNVVFVQGSLRLTSDELTITAEDGAVQQATASGTPARVRRETETGRLVRANAATIDYDAQAGLIVLTGEAELLRDGERFAAGKIRYWTESRRVEGGRGDDGERVRIRLEPGEQESSGSEQQTPSSNP